MSTGTLSVEDARLLASILGDTGNSMPSPSSSIADDATNVSKKWPVLTFQAEINQIDMSSDTDRLLNIGRTIAPFVRHTACDIPIRYVVCCLFVAALPQRRLRSIVHGWHANAAKELQSQIGKARQS